MRHLLCALRGLWGTVTMPAFWRLGITYSGHVWPWPPAWSAPAPSPDPDYWPGLVEFDDSACVECGHRPSPRGWRKSWMVR